MSDNTQVRDPRGVAPNYNDIIGLPIRMNDGQVALALMTVAAPVGAPAATSVAASATSVTLLAANPARRAVAIFNASVQPLSISETSPATVAGATGIYTVAPHSLWVLPDPTYAGALYGIWANADASGAAKVNEYS